MKFIPSHVPLIAKSNSEIVSDIAVFVLKRDIILQPTNLTVKTALKSVDF